jgi:heptosyltransferase II
MPEQVIEAGKRLECGESAAQPIALQRVDPPHFVANAGKRSEPE